MICDEVQMELQLPWCSSVLCERVKNLQAPAHLSSKGEIRS